MTFSNFTSDEREILQLTAQGNERAFRVLFDRYHKKLALYIFRITKSMEISEDIVQEVFLKIWINRSELTEVKNFKTYLFVISKNAAFNWLKSDARQSLMLDVIDVHHEALETESVETDERYLLIDEAIDCLPDQQRKVYILSRHERLKYEEIALQMNISRETVKKYLQIAGNSISNYIRNKSSVLRFILFILFFEK